MAARRVAENHGRLSYTRHHPLHEITRIFVGSTASLPFSQVPHFEYNHQMYTYIVQHGLKVSQLNTIAHLDPLHR